MAENIETLRFDIDWELEKEPFHILINKMIAECVEKGNVLVLPVGIIRGESFAGQLALLLSQIHCEKCKALCCKSLRNGLPISVSTPEYRYLSGKYGAEKFITSSTWGYALPLPCPFLKSDKCSIYPDRPLICGLYPFEPGGTSGEQREVNTLALSSECPESRRITRAVFMTSWRLRRQFVRTTGVKFVGSKDSQFQV